MFRNLFNPDSDLMVLMARITDCIFLSIFFFFGSLPVITLGAVAAAMYDGAYRGIRKGDKHSWGRFLTTFKGSFKASLVPTVVALLVFGIGLWLLIQLWNGAVAGYVNWMVFSGAALVGMVVLGVLSVLFPMLSRFENPTGVLLRNTVLLALANLPRTLILGIWNAVVIFVCVRWVFPVFLLPAFGAFISSFLIEPMFKPYMPEEETEE